MRVLIATLILSLTLTSPVWAAKKSSKKETPPETAQTEFSFPIPSSELKLNSELGRNAEPAPAGFEFAVSSWQPDQFSRPTYQNGESRFSAGSFPFVSVNRIAPLVLSDQNMGIFWKLGVAAASLRRTVSQTQAGGAHAAEQSLTLLSLRFGVEMQGPRYLADVIRPMLGLSLLPTIALAPRSELEESVNARGLPAEVIGGALIYPHPLMPRLWGLDGGVVGVAAQYVFGSVDESRMDGFGALGFFRMNL